MTHDAILLTSSSALYPMYYNLPIHSGVLGIVTGIGVGSHSVRVHCISVHICLEVVHDSEHLPEVMDVSYAHATAGTMTVTI